MNSLFNRFRTVRKLILIVAAVVLLGGTAWGLWQWRSGRNGAAGFRTEKVTRGRLVATINASGTLVPEEVIDVGAQVAGQIHSFGPDLDDPSRKTIDYNSRVEVGTVLAKIDDTLYEADVRIAKADLLVARADEVKSGKDLLSARAKVDQRKQDLESAQTTRALAAKNLERDTTTFNRAALDKATLDLTRSTVGVTQANVESARAAIADAEASVASAEANLVKANKSVIKAQEMLAKADKNLQYCTIKSTINGVILDRRVNIGQTVVSSLTAPSLFLIAKDLTRLQVWASVNEADIGRINPGQKAFFKVDAYPSDVFQGTVSQVRLNATNTQNVVTYTVVVDTRNDKQTTGGKLKPYLTANLQFRVANRGDALLVPNAALRYRPTPERVAPEHREAFEKGLRRRPGAPMIQVPDAKAKARQDRATLWVEENGFVRPIKVRTGLTDSIHTEIIEVLDGELNEGADLVTGEQQAKSGGGANPFAPKLFGPKKP